MNDNDKRIMDILLSMLIKVKKDKDFAIGVISNAEDSEGWEMVIDFINEFPNADSEQILLYSIMCKEDWK